MGLFDYLNEIDRQEKENAKYEQGVKDGQKGGFIDDAFQSAGSVISTSPYDKGYRYGAQNRYDPQTGERYHTHGGKGTNDPKPSSQDSNWGSNYESSSSESSSSGGDYSYSGSSSYSGGSSSSSGDASVGGCLATLLGVGMVVMGLVYGINSISRNKQDVEENKAPRYAEQRVERVYSESPIIEIREPEERVRERNLKNETNSREEVHPDPIQMYERNMQKLMVETQDAIDRGTGYNNYRNTVQAPPQTAIDHAAQEARRRADETMREIIRNSQEKVRVEKERNAQEERDRIWKAERAKQEDNWRKAKEEQDRKWREENEKRNREWKEANERRNREWREENEKRNREWGRQ